MPLNVVDGVRVNTAMAYLSPRRGRRAHRARRGAGPPGASWRRGRAVGVETDDGVVRAAEVVLCAGAVGSPHLLLLSGIGPADDLRRAGIDVVADLPGVGRRVQRPPERLRRLPARPRRCRAARALPLHGVLHATSAGSELPGDLEILPWLTPFSRITGGRTHGDDLVVGVGLQRADSRGPADAWTTPTRAGSRGWSTATSPRRADRRRLREGVRLAADLLRGAAAGAAGRRPHRPAGRRPARRPASSTAGCGRT